MFWKGHCDTTEEDVQKYKSRGRKTSSNISILLANISILLAIDDGTLNYKSGLGGKFGLRSFQMVGLNDILDIDYERGATGKGDWRFQFR